MKFVFWPIPAVLSATFLLLACSHQVELKAEQTRVEAQGLALQVNWLKDKGKKYDVELGITNNTGKDIVFQLGDMSCFRGTQQGMLKHTFFNTGERTIDFRSGQAKIFRLVCTLGNVAEGEYMIKIHNIRENPNGDGSSTGKLLIKSIAWKAPAQ